jgi:hypothetical protein
MYTEEQLEELKDSPVGWLFLDVDGGLVRLETTHFWYKADVLRTGGTPRSDISRLNQEECDIILLSSVGSMYLKILATYPKNEPYKDIINELARKPSGCPGSLKNGWWQRTLDQITGLTFHHTLSNSPHATASHYITKGGGRPSIPYSIWITQTGEALLCNPLTDGCWHDHTGHRNTRLSVGLAGRLHEYRPAQVQLEAAARIVKWAVGHSEMNITLESVKGHMDVGTYAGRTECPGWDSKKSGYWKDKFMALLA